MKAPPPIHVWRESVDDATEAILASCFLVQRRSMYGISTFVLIERAKARDWRFDWRAAGQRHLKECLAKDHGGRLPYIGYAHEQVS